MIGVYSNWLIPCQEMEKASIISLYTLSRHKWCYTLTRHCHHCQWKFLTLTLRQSALSPCSSKRLALVSNTQKENCVHDIPSFEKCYRKYNQILTREEWNRHPHSTVNCGNFSYVIAYGPRINKKYNVFKYFILYTTELTLY